MSIVTNTTQKCTSISKCSKGPKSNLRSMKEEESSLSSGSPMRRSQQAGCCWLVTFLTTTWRGRMLGADVMEVEVETVQSALTSLYSHCLSTKM
jgi:hypothetical protein